MLRCSTSKQDVHVAARTMWLREQCMVHWDADFADFRRLRQVQSAFLLADNCSIRRFSCADFMEWICFVLCGEREQERERESEPDYEIALYIHACSILLPLFNTYILLVPSPPTKD